MPFYRRLELDNQHDITVFCQSEIAGGSLISDHDRLSMKTVTLRYMSLKSESLCWQFLPYKNLADFDCYFIYGNPRVVSNVIFSLYLKFRRKPVVIWGQAHTGNANRVTEWLRHLWWKIFDYIYVYTDFEKQYLIDKGFVRAKIVGMNNGLDQRKIVETTKRITDKEIVEWKINNNINDKIVLLTCARHEPKNQFELIINALPAIIAEYPNVVLCMIGQGRATASLKDLSNRIGVNDHICWLHEIYDEDALAPWFMSARYLIHPGSIGLTLLHAFGYGLPVITHSNREAHMPEFFVMDDKMTGYVFEEGSYQSLSETVLVALSETVGLATMKKATREIADNVCNVDVMVSRFNHMIDLVESDIKN